METIADYLKGNPQEIGHLMSEVGKVMLSLHELMAREIEGQAHETDRSAWH